MVGRTNEWILLNKQHRQTVTVHLPIDWGTTRLSFIRPTELEPTIYKYSYAMKLSYQPTRVVCTVPQAETQSYSYIHHGWGEAIQE